MKLNLERPLVFFDLETTGVNISTDRIVEISMVKVMPNGDEETKTRRINPEMNIPAESTAIHGITNEDVKDCPTFKQLANGIKAYIDGCDMAGYNSDKFDVPLLNEEFNRAGVEIDMHDRKYIDVQTIFYKKEPRTLIAAYAKYCGKNLEEAHSANADTQATVDVLKAQLDTYTDLENNVDFLSEYSHHNRLVDFAGLMVYNDKDEIVFNFGKYKGKKVEDILSREPSYYAWIENGKFTQDSKDCLKKVKDGMKKK